MRVYRKFDLTDYNSYKIHSICDEVFFPDTENDVIDLYRKRNDYVILGGGNNVIFSKNHYNIPFIIFNNNFCNVSIKKDIIEAEAGVMMETLSCITLDNGLSGLEIFYDIPASLGGAVFMNAGSGGEEIKDILTKVKFLDLSDMQIKEIEVEDINFQYRNSFFQQNKNILILKVWLKLQKKDKGEISTKMEKLKQQRWIKQPREFPSAGSVFKRPQGYYVGQMVEELGLKGFKIGGAMVSEKHAGFIVNTGNATGSDIFALIETIQRNVRNKFGIDLIVEQRII